jgi:hypothetical protein
LRSYSLCNILSHEKIGFVFYEYVWLCVKCTYRTYSILLKILPFALHTNPLVSPGFAKQIMPMLCNLCYNGSLVT